MSRRERVQDPGQDEPVKRRSKWDASDLIGSIDASPEEVAQALFRSGPMTNREVEEWVRGEGGL